MKMMKYDITRLLGDIELNKLIAFTDSYLVIIYKLNSFMYIYIYIYIYICYSRLIDLKET